MPLSRPTPFLSLTRASFRLGDRLIFPNTSWIFRRGEHWGVVGPNGSGKSLLADCLCGRLPLVAGELRYHFRPPVRLIPEQCIGRVSFETRRAELHGEVVQSRWNSLEEEGALLVREYLAYERVMDINPFELGLDDEKARRLFENRFRRANRLLVTEPLLEHPLLSLSNGERQRVEIARALSRPLRLLILDDPFAGLDAASRERLGQVLEHIMSLPVPVLFLARRTEDLPRQITHVLLLRDCKVLETHRRRDWERRRASSANPKSEIGNPKQAPKTTTMPVSRIPLVELRNVTVRYGASTILDHVNWTIRNGESWALLGPNGSGKTTLLSLIQGDNPQAYQNHVAVFGKQRGGGESIWDLKRQLGSVSPELHLHFSQHATCLEVVASSFFESNGLFEAPSSRQLHAARSWLARFRLSRFADTPLWALSAGRQRMALLARALVKRPRLTLLDEPCQGLDARHRNLFIGTVDDLIRRGSTTVVYVTHREEEIPPSIVRVARLDQGRLLLEKSEI